MQPKFRLEKITNKYIILQIFVDCDLSLRGHFYIFHISHKFRQLIIENLQACKRLGNHVAQWKSKILGASTLIQKPSDIDLISQGLHPHLSFTLVPLFKGSKDGYKIKDYRAKTQDKGPLLIVIENDQGQRFGAYDHTPFKSNEEPGILRIGSTDFLFSLTKSSVHNALPDKVISTSRYNTIDKQTQQ